MKRIVSRNSNAQSEEKDNSGESKPSENSYKHGKPDEYALSAQSELSEQPPLCEQNEQSEPSEGSSESTGVLKNREDGEKKRKTSSEENTPVKGDYDGNEDICERSEEKREESNASPTSLGNHMSIKSMKSVKSTLSSPSDDRASSSKLSYGVRLKSKKRGGKSNVSKLFGSEDTHMSRNRKLEKENLKMDMRNFFIPSQEKDIYEYVPDTSNYSMSNNDSNELYKDVVTMNKHFLDEININIYSSPLDTYLSSMLATLGNSKQESKNLLLESDPQMLNIKNSSLDKKKNSILDEDCIKKPMHSYEFYRNKILKHDNNGVIIDVDPSKLNYNNANYYEYDHNMYSYSEDPLSYLQKLKCEVEDITQYISEIANVKKEQIYSSNTNDRPSEEELAEHEKIVKKILHNREAPEVLMELFSLKNDINNILNDDTLTKIIKMEKEKKIAQEEHPTDNHTTDVKTLLEMLNNLEDNEKREDGEKNDGQKKMGHMFSLPAQFGIYTAKNTKEKDVQVSDLLMLERKIFEIEKALGIEKMSLLPYDDLNHAILDLYNKLSLLDSTKLENVKKKMQNLQSEFLNLKKFKKDLLNLSKERGNYEESIDELFKILDIWKKTHHIIPNVLARLQQLKKIHDNAQSFSARLDDLENQQTKLDDTLSLAEKNIKLINCKIDENVNLLQDMLKKMESEDALAK
ncbi:dynactin subunit 2, putative [Plasmodium ovale]|uniref:Dynactin subunit 2, putative n=2 Tax=Plasmodium ovale TaxID=36330 RepID=A0A1A8VZD0_PLAOA|nr:dynactin subunit 2, putative [Plasmodium ovale curtisi]SBS96115.1 dynactin subunit 2, putative [Plasmodium ovale curtisi]SCP05313.1 dynactin subunit 2, putative [Plasmodium ovale]